MGTLLIQIDNDAADVCELDAALRVLWSELSSAHGLEVAGQYDDAPANVKASTGGALSSLAITMLGSGGIAIALLRVFGGWLMRYRDFRIKVKRGNSLVEITGANPADIAAVLPQLERLLDAKQR